jgi:hypothetical protein
MRRKKRCTKEAPSNNEGPHADGIAADNGPQRKYKKKCSEYDAKIAIRPDPRSIETRALWV